MSASQRVKYDALTHFREWLRRKVAREGLTRRGVARLSGVDQSTVTRLLNGEREPTLATALKIVEALA